MIGHCIYAQKVSEIPYRFECKRLSALKRTLEIKDIGKLCRTCLYRTKPNPEVQNR